MQEKKLSIVYRIAVIMNESGLMRNWYSNVMPNLRALNRFGNDQRVFKDEYEFISYTRLNLQNLFDKTKEDYIESYDALFVSTNATNDDEVYDILVKNKHCIEKYLEKNKGIFIGSQKKISKTMTSIKDENNIKGTMGFLPELFSYELKRRSGENSDKGYIEIFSEEDYIVSGKEKESVEEEINYICLHNQFKSHKFRSYIVLQNEDLFETVLIDKTSQISKNELGEYDEKNDPVIRKLLVRCKAKKIVYSSIALDYENQEFLLRNILQYIVKGKSLVGFFDGNNFSLKNDRKFNYLFLNTCLKKIATSEYHKLDCNEKYILNNRIFVVSSYFSENQVKAFWDKLCKKKDMQYSNYLRLLHLKKSKNNENIITEYTNYSSIDNIIKRVLSWILSEYVSNYNSNISAKQRKINIWGTDYWITYDVFTFMYEISNHYPALYYECYNPYLLDYLLEIENKHYKIQGDSKEIGSYDGMLNCSSALLEIFCMFNIENLKVRYPELSMLSIEKTFAYIVNNLSHAVENEIDKETALISFSIIKNYQHIPSCMLTFYKRTGSFNYFTLLDDIIEKRIIKLFGFEGKVKSVPIPILESRYKDIAEIDLCRDIEVICIKLKIEKENSMLSSEKLDCLNTILYNHLRSLLNLQKNGYWANISRTASVLKVLVRCSYYYDPEKYSNINSGYMIQQAIMTGVNSLLNDYNQMGEYGNWNHDMLTTANAIYALNLFDLQNKNIMNDLLDSIIYSQNVIEFSETITDTMRSLTVSRMQNENLMKEIIDIKNHIIEVQKDSESKKNEVIRLEENINNLKEEHEKEIENIINNMQIRCGIRVQIFMWITFTFGIMFILYYFNLFTTIGESRREIAVFAISFVISAIVAEIISLIRGMVSNFKTSNPISMYILKKIRKKSQ